MGLRSRWNGKKHCGQWRNFHDTYRREVRDEFERKRTHQRAKIASEDIDEYSDLMWRRKPELSCYLQPNVVRYEC